MSKCGFCDQYHVGPCAPSVVQAPCSVPSDVLRRELMRLAAVIDETLTDLQTLANLVDDPTAVEIIDHAADRLGAALRI